MITSHLNLVDIMELQCTGKLLGLLYTFVVKASLVLIISVSKPFLGCMSIDNLIFH